MSQDYIINYVSDVTQAVTGVNELAAAVRTLGKLFDEVKAKAEKFAKSIPASANAAAKAVDKLNVAMGKLDAQAVAASGAVANVGKAAAGAGTGLTAAGTATTSLGTRLSTAAAKATTSAVALNGLAAGANTAAPALAATGAAAGAMVPRLGAAAKNSNDLGGSLGRFGAMSVGIMAAHMAIRALADAMNDAREYAEKVAADLHKIREDVRELRAIKGDEVTNAQAVAGVADLLMDTGATKEEAIAFEKMWESALPAAQQNVDEVTGKKNWQLDEAQTKAAKVTALQFAIANQIPPEVMGRMVPSIGIGQPVTSEEDLKGQLAAMHALAVQGVGTFGPIMKVFNKLRPMMVRAGGGGATKSSAELLGVISAQTVVAGREAQVSQDISQVWRELSVAGTPKKKETFAKYGIQPGKDDYTRSVEKIAPLITEARAAGKSDLDALRDAGFTNMGANAKIIAAVANRAVLRKRVDIVPKLADPKRVDKIITDFKQDFPMRFAEAAAETAEWERGKEMDPLLPARKFAEAGRNRNREINTFASNVEEGIGTVLSGFGIFGEKGREQELDSEVRDRLRAAVPGYAKRFPGIDLENAEGADLAKILGELTPEENAAFRAEMQAFAASGKRTPTPSRGAIRGADSEVRDRLRAAVPGYAKRFPGIDLENAEGADLAKILGELTPEENAAFRAGPAPEGGAPVIRPRGGAAPGPPGAAGVGPQASAFGAGGRGGATDPLMMGVQKEQAKYLSQIVAALRPRPVLNGAGGPTLGPLPFDDGDFGGRRA